mmetsp:Transcript_21578/g.62516  ORF Transcript_21578/g.62516 Transcript_21578/m.62516 type:complete len:232 (-) Transcript_21578:63-758(-)
MTVDGGFLPGEPYEVKSTVTVRASEAAGSARRKDLRPGAVVNLLEFGTSGRARVAVGDIEGWISMETSQGRPFLGKIEGRQYPVGKIAPRKPQPRGAGGRSAAMPLAGWETLGPGRDRPAAVIDPMRAPPMVMAAAETSGMPFNIPNMEDLTEDDLIEGGIFSPHEARRFVQCTPEEKKRITQMLRESAEWEQRPPPLEVDLEALKAGVRLGLHCGDGVPDGDLMFVPNWG